MSVVESGAEIPVVNSSLHNVDPLDDAGQSILRLLRSAAETAEQNNKLILETARSLSIRLEEANDRIRDLEADLKYYQERAQKAEQWFSKISSEIEQTFTKAEDGRRPSERPSFQRLRPFPRVVEQE